MNGTLAYFLAVAVATVVQVVISHFFDAQRSKKPVKLSVRKPWHLCLQAHLGPRLQNLGQKPETEPTLSGTVGRWDCSEPSNMDPGKLETSYTWQATT